MVSITKTITSKLIWAALGSIVLYLSANFLGLVPKSWSNFVAYLQANTVAFLFTLCFIIACYTIIKIKTKRRNKYGE
jgi:hypothetical protein